MADSGGGGGSLEVMRGSVSCQTVTRRQPGLGGTTSEGGVELSGDGCAGSTVVQEAAAASVMYIMIVVLACKGRGQR